MAFVDIDLRKDDKEYYDIYFDENGDLGKTEGFNTALKMSLLCEKRASASESPVLENRRGWWGNAYLGVDNYELGSKLWLLYQSRATQNTLNNSITFSDDGLRWLVEDGYLDKIIVNAEYNSNYDLIQRIDLIRSNNVVQSLSYSIWDNTILELSNGE